ncbi:signal transduction histidine kinase [Candidatus Scalindua japonica]|uniref:histidine kinase n=1 Tax=Candidatus Scalindua japonica TaxID=1284222 RepID=A0A286TZZ2_9BACT|nr:signal transduction histidine kinase [Candidatus Scalindua japonica]
MPIIVVAILTYQYAQETIKNELFKEQSFIAGGIKNHILTIIDSGEYSSQFFASDEFIRMNLEKLNNNPGDKLAVKEFNDYMVYKTNLNPGFYETFILNPSGIVVASSNKNSIGMNEVDEDYFKYGKEDTYVKDVYRDNKTGEYSIAFAAPILKKSEEKLLGVLVIRFNADKLNEITVGKKIITKADMGAFHRRGLTSEVYIVNKGGFLITESRFMNNAILRQMVQSEPIVSVHSQGKEFVGVYRDYRGVNVIGAAVYLKKMDWVLVVETDESEAYSTIYTFKNRVITLVGICIVGVIFVSLFVSRGIINPILMLVKGMKKVAGGDLNFRVETRLKDELGELTGSFNQMTCDIKDSREKLLGLKSDLEERKEYLESVLRFANELIFTLDARGNFTFVNPKIKDWGYTEEDLIGTPLISVFFDNKRKNDNRVIHSDFPRRFEVEILDKQKNIRNVLLSTSPIKNKEGVLISILGIASDITELRKLEQKLVQSDRLASIGQLIAGIAHEINNPIGVIYLYSTESLKIFEKITSGFKDISSLSISEYTQHLDRIIANMDSEVETRQGVGLLKKELMHIRGDLGKYHAGLGETYTIISKNRSCLHEYLEGSVRESIRCKELISGLLDFSRQKEPKMALSNVNNLIDNVLNIVEKQYHKEKINVIRKPGSNIPDCMMDSHQIEQVIINIANNAVFAMQEAAGDLGHRDVYRKGALTMGTEFHADKKLVEIFISDTGKGINKYDFNKIFDPFFTARKDGKGTGLGLSISYGIVKMHEGNIEVESEVGKGTTFRVLLPVRIKNES